MNAETIQELANQLHISVDEVVQYIPAYAQSQITFSILPLFSA